MTDEPRVVSGSFSGQPYVAAWGGRVRGAGNGARGRRRPWWTQTKAMYQRNGARHGRRKPCDRLVAPAGRPPEESEARMLLYESVQDDPFNHLPFMLRNVWR